MGYRQYSQACGENTTPICIKIVSQKSAILFSNLTQILCYHIMCETGTNDLATVDHKFITISHIHNIDFCLSLFQHMVLIACCTEHDENDPRSQLMTDLLTEISSVVIECSTEDEYTKVANIRYSGHRITCKLDIATSCGRSPPSQCHIQ